MSSAADVSPPANGTPSTSTRERFVRGVLVTLLLAGAVLAALVSWNRELQVDEVEHVHTAYNLRDGRLIYRDFVQVHPPLYYAWLYPWVDVEDPVGSFRRARLASALALAMTIALIAACARRLEGRTAALLAAGLALLETTFVERGIEARGDGILALLLTAALALELGERPASELRRFALEALLLGVALMVTLKAIFPIVLFGLRWVAASVRRRSLAPLAAPLVGGLVPVGATFALAAGFGVLGDFVRQALVDASTAGAGSSARSTFGPAGFLWSEGRHNVVFFLLFGLVLAAEARAVLLARAREPRRAFLLLLALGMFASLWANPFPWPYVHVPVLPAMIVLVSTGVIRYVEAAAGKGRPWAAWLPALFLLGAALTAAPRLAAKSLPGTGAQFATLRDVEIVSEPNDRFFDLAGLYFRPDAYPVFAMSGDLFRWYTLGRFPPIPEALRANEAVGIVLNYRVGWLRPHERAFVRDRFVHWDRNLFLLGRDLTLLTPGLATEFEVLKRKRFRFDGEGSLLVDGEPFREGELERGIHLLLVERLSGPGRLILASAPPRAPAAEVVELFSAFD